MLEGNIRFAAMLAVGIAITFVILSTHIEQRASPGYWRYTDSL